LRIAAWFFGYGLWTLAHFPLINIKIRAPLEILIDILRKVIELHVFLGAIICSLSMVWLQKLTALVVRLLV